MKASNLEPRYNEVPEGTEKCYIESLPVSLYVLTNFLENDQKLELRGDISSSYYGRF